MERNVFTTKAEFDEFHSRRCSFYNAKDFMVKWSRTSMFTVTRVSSNDSLLDSNHQVVFLIPPVLHQYFNIDKLIINSVCAPDCLTGTDDEPYIWRKISESLNRIVWKTVYLIKVIKHITSDKLSCKYSQLILRYLVCVCGFYLAQLL